MFRLETSGRAKMDSLPEAIHFAKEIAEYVNKRYSPITVQVYSEIEDFDTIHWYSDYKDLAAIQGFRARLRSDQGYWAMVFKGMDYFMEGNFHEVLMSSA